MRNGNDSPSYRLLKWAWLLFQASILPVSALYLSTAPSELSVIPVARIALFLLGSAFLVFWLIGQSLLAMYRFPLGTAPALRLVSGQALQFVLIFLAGASWTFAFYLSFITKLAAVIILVMILAGWKLLARPLRLFRVLFYLCLAFLCLLFLNIFLGPLLIGLSGLQSWQIAVDIAAMTLNIGQTVYTLYSYSIFARPSRLSPLYDRAWQKWAPATVILLILSAVAAAVIAGTRGIQQTADV
ncbi:MAG: hypothetical protein MUP19_03470 [Candidatus Aminicenantes bacterium]|nr:hypothetical protein [Candidatus Aminicenantes bacterium]